ncbi:hypothetical protein LTR78_010342 [Recurvomyces mirabilis]|uniref:Fungal N-terminal domain-containing protein n=1 Tax=Recurvomyces mirabilis TaxID=574656 RepID=A0AAE0TN60_9PEZI|nr:hypothetical protein LTR78_010342 [Recurvomyces mirabilis]KAK5156217.1 hypothetical protein LTS14_005104 [Recurvomyces mirabilis]
MADPITAIGTASAALQIAQMALQTGSYLCKLAKAISKVEQTISSLGAEAIAVSNACNLINQEIEGVLPAQGVDGNSKYDEDGSLWKSVTLQLVATRNTVRDLRAIVGEDDNESKDFFQRARKQIHLDRNKDGLAAIQHRLHVHTQSLQMALQMVNIKVAYLAPKIVTDDLGDKIEDLKMGIQTLQSEYQLSGQKGMTPSEVELIQCAKDIMRSGKTLCEESSAGGDMQSGEKAARLNKLVAEWTVDVESLRRDTERSAFSDAETQIPSILSGDDLPLTSAVLTTPIDQDEDDRLCQNTDETDDEEDDFSLEIAQAALEQGQQAFDQEDWREAEALLKEALSTLKTLSPKHRTGCDIFELEYRLTVCAYHTREPAIAKEALMSLVGQTPTSDEQKARIYDAAHLLAQLHLREGELEPARMTCESTLKARSKLLGRTHDSYLESLALMAHVHFVQGNAPRAKVLMGMIPEPRRTALRESLQVLPTPRSPMVLGDVDVGSIAETLDSQSTTIQQSANVRSDSLPDLPTERLDSGMSLHFSESRHGSRDSRTNEYTFEKVNSLEPVHLHTVATQSDKVVEAGGLKSERFDRTDSIITQGITPSVASSVDRSAREVILTHVGREPRGMLERAICGGDLELALSVITTDDQMAVSRDSFALHYAACFGDLEVAAALLKQGWKVNSVVRTKATMRYAPLDLAMATRRPLMVRLLLEHGAELVSGRPNGYGGDVRNCYPFAIWLEKPWCTAFPATESSDMIACIAHALDHGWVIDQPIGFCEDNAEPTGFKDDSGVYTCTLLRQIVRNPQVGTMVRCTLVDFLLKHRASPLDTLHRGQTILHTAIWYNRPDVIPVLLKNNAEVQLAQRCNLDKLVSSGEEDALCLAVRLAASKRTGAATVKALLTAGAKVSSKNKVRAADVPASLQRQETKQKLKNMLKRDFMVSVTPLEIAQASGSTQLMRIMQEHIH